MSVQGNEALSSSSDQGQIFRSVLIPFFFLNPYVRIFFPLVSRESGGEGGGEGERNIKVTVWSEGRRSDH